MLWLSFVLVIAAGVWALIERQHRVDCESEMMELLKLIKSGMEGATFEETIAGNLRPFYLRRIDEMLNRQ
jgi:hypothetical protein